MTQGVQSLRSVTLDFLLRAAQAAPSADNAQPWRIERDDERLIIAYETNRSTRGSFSADAPATLLAIGALIENVVQAAEAIGASIVPRWLPAGHPLRFASLAFTPPESVPDQLPHPPLFKRHTNRGAFRRQALPHTWRDSFASGTETGTRVLSYQDSAQRTSIAQLVRRASEVRFQTQELHEALASSLRFGREAESGEGLDVATLGMPTGASVFLKFILEWRRMRVLNRFGAYHLFAAMDAKLLAAAPEVIAIVSDRGREPTLEAGRLMQRVWIRLNQLGLAVQPFYVVSDQIDRLAHGRIPHKLVPKIEAIRQELPAVLGLAAGEVLQILFRVGYPARSVARSRRLPLGRIFVDGNTEQQAAGRSI